MGSDIRTPNIDALARRALMTAMCNCAIRSGPFKLVRKHGQAWELYDMDADRTELDDLAGKDAPLEAELLAQYADWAEKTGVLDWDVALPQLLEAWKIGSAEG